MLALGLAADLPARAVPRWVSAHEHRIDAVHESGHLVTALLVGYRVSSAEILRAPEGGLRAQTQLAGRWRQPEPWADLAVSLAGPLAESIYSGRDLLAVLNDGQDFPDSDLHRARREAQRLARLGLYRSPDHALLVAEGHAQRLLTAHWHFVMQTAHKLVVQGRIE